MKYINIYMKYLTFMEYMKSITVRDCTYMSRQSMSSEHWGNEFVNPYRTDIRHISGNLIYLSLALGAFFVLACDKDDGKGRRIVRSGEQCSHTEQIIVAKCLLCKAVDRRHHLLTMYPLLKQKKYARFYASANRKVFTKLDFQKLALVSQSQKNLRGLQLTSAVS